VFLALLATGGLMKFLRHLIVIVQIFAITLYPQMVPDGSAAALPEDLPKVASTHGGHHAAYAEHECHGADDAASGEKALKLVAEDNRPCPISGPVKDAPCCNIGGGICTAMISEGQEVLRPSDSLDFEIGISAPLAEMNPALLPHPPKTAA
jgi:hypothetical protein